MAVLVPDAVWTPDGLRSGWSVEVLGDGRIGRVGPAAPDGERLAGTILTPGLVNGHSHAFQRALRGHVQWTEAGRDDFWTWRTPMYALASALDPDAMAALTALCFVEMVESGITTVGEFHYVHHPPAGGRYADPDAMARAVAHAAEVAGIGLVLLRAAYYRNGPGRPLLPGQRPFADDGPDETLAAVERLAAAGMRVGLAPHSVRAVPVDALEALTAWNGLVHCHVAEQPAEVDAVRAESGTGPLRVLEAAGLLHERTTVVHGTWPDPGDPERLCAAGATLCVVPSTEVDLGDGFLPLGWRNGARLCVGTDSHARVDLLAEARDVEWHARALSGRRNVMAEPSAGPGRVDDLAERILRIASVHGGVALGMPGRGIATGEQADLVAWDIDVPEADGAPPLVFLAFHAGRQHVRDVWVAGRRVVRSGRHPSRDAVRAVWASERCRLGL
jgi:formimidoylglutamate deiminase